MYYTYTPSNQRFFKHRDGGIYVLIDEGKYSVDASAVVIYKHLWPFEQGMWVRPAVEFFDGRFKELTGEEYAVEIARSGNRTEAQEAVNKAKAARKGSGA